MMSVPATAKTAEGTTVTRWIAQTFGAAACLKPAAVAALGPGLSYDADTGLVGAQFEVKAPTLRAATAAALRQARTLLPVKPDEIIVKPADRHLAEVEHPAPLDLLSVGDAAAVLGVSATRVVQLWKNHPSFPQPIARPRSGPIWTRASVSAFKTRRDTDRLPVGRPRKTSHIATVAAVAAGR